MRIYNKMNKKRILTIVLVLATVVGMVPGFTLTASAVSAPAQTSNIGDHNYAYDRWANPIKSYLEDNGDGTLTRVEYTGEAVTVETYGSDLQFVDGFTIDMELPIFGGFHSGEKYNFLVFGQENPNEDDSLEVIRVVSYTKEWERVGAASLYGANTTVPFDGGSLRFAEYNGYLYIRTAHEMYMSNDGKNHQSNLTMNVRIADMKITDSLYEKQNVRYGYISHSFNQFIAVDGTDLVAVDHSDANPRSVVLFRYNAPAGQDSFLKAEKEYITNTSYRNVYTKYVDVLPIMGSNGDNDTGVAVGGFEISDSAYLIAGNTVSQDDTYNAFGQRNIFIIATAKEADLSTAKTTIHYLTSYAEGDGVTISNPHFVKVTNDKYAILWTESGSSTGGLRYAFVNGRGELISKIYTISAVLSDCAPIVFGGKLIWYATSASVPAFFTIDLADPETVTQGHIYTYSYVSYPRYTTAGILSCVCAVCGEPGKNVIIPAIQGSDEYTIYRVDSEPTCTTDGYGYYRWNKLANYDVDQYGFGGSIPATGHTYGYTNNGSNHTVTCSECEYKDTEDHSYSDATLRCICGATKSVTIIAPAEIGFTVRGQTVTTEYNLVCKVGYLNGKHYVAIDAVANADGSYSFTAPDEVSEVLLVVIGDVDQDGDLDSDDTDALGAALQPGAAGLSAEKRFAADINENGKLNSADLILIGRSILDPSNTLYKALEW